MAQSVLKSRTLWPVALILGWLLPGSGHWLLGRRLRAGIISSLIILMFLIGLAMGGIFTIDPRKEKWWQYAQLGCGLPAVICNVRQELCYKDYLAKGEKRAGPFVPQHTKYKNSTIKEDRQKYLSEINTRRNQVLGYTYAFIAEDGLALVDPVRPSAIIYTSVAGLMNIMCAIDATLLCMMGSFGEPKKGVMPPEAGEE